MKTALLALFSMLKMPLCRMLSSLKFWTVIVGTLSTYLAKKDIVLDPEMAKYVAGFFALLLAGQGLQDHGKERAKVEAQRGFAVVELLVALVAIAGLCSLVACSWLKSETKQTASTVVDCASQQAKELTEQLSPTFEQLLDRATGGDGRIDWPSIDDATSRLKATAWCALENTVARILSRVPLSDGVMSSPLEQNREQLLGGVADLRRRKFAGVTFENASSP